MIINSDYGSMMMKSVPPQNFKRDGRAVGVTKEPSLELSSVEAQVLSQERAMKSASAGADTTTTYRYEMGPDGRRYIVGAEVSITGTEDQVGGVGGGVTKETIAPSRPDNEKTGEGASSEKTAEPDKAGEADREDREDKKTENDNENSREVKAAVNELKQIEREVISHEAAHMAAGGQYAGGVSYSYTTGPDGKKYIVGGEVPISVPASDDPRETLAAAAQVMRAALAPADPSGADIAVAASAAQMQAQARAEISGAESADDGSEESGDLWGLASGYKKTEETRAGEAENTVLQPVRQAKEVEEAYSSAASTRGLWSSENGFEDRTAGDINILTGSTAADGQNEDTAVNRSAGRSKPGELLDVAA